MEQFTITNRNGIRLTATDYACTITELLVPDSKGQLISVDTDGILVGRYANRIENSCFTVNDQTYHLTPNEGKNHLHGTFSSRCFAGQVEGNRIVFALDSPDGEEGFPGHLTGTLSYELTEDNSLVIAYRVTTDHDTILNLTNHSYFNLNGIGSGDVYGHLLQIFADSYTETNDELIPTGQLLSVADSRMDFRTLRPVGEAYDDNFVLGSFGTMRKAAVAIGEKTGIVLTCYTDQPGVQLYTGNPNGLCLETQHFAASPSHPHFPTTVLRAGEEFVSTTVYRFSAL